MKRSTLIMFALILSGVLVIAAFFTVMRCTGEKIDREVAVLSAETDTIPLSNSKEIAISLNYVYTTHDGGHDTISVYVPEAKFCIKSCPDIDTPLLELPDNLIGEVLQDTIDDQLKVSVLSADSYYHVGDSSKNMTLLLPGDSEIKSIKILMDFIAGVSVSDMKQDTLAIASARDLDLLVDNDTIAYMQATGFKSINVKESALDNMKVFSWFDVSVNVDPAATVGHTILAGRRNFTYEISGIEDFEVQPRDGEYITVKKKYYGNSPR